MRERLAIAGALGGIAVLAAVVFVVFQFGRVDPSPPSLVENPNPAIPGEILYIDNANCLVRAAASGASRTVTCAEELRIPSAFAWVDGDTIAFWEVNALYELDLDTGERRRRTDVTGDDQRFPDQPGFSVNGEQAVTEGGTLYVIGRDGSREKVASFDVGSRWIQAVRWSPDGRWIIVQWYPPRDSGSELWIVSRDGKTRGTLVDEGIWFPFALGWWIEGVGGEPQLEDIVALARE